MPPIVDHKVLNLIFRAIRKAPGIFKVSRESECVEFSAPSQYAGSNQRYEIVVREIDEETKGA